MSKHFRAIFPITLAFWQILHFFNNSYAQDIEATIKFDSARPQIAVIECKIPAGSQISGAKNVAFLRSYAGIENLADRISDISFYDAEGRPVPGKQLIPGEFVAESNISAWKYSINLAPQKNASSSAHISWLSDSEGLLMLDDMLPQFAARFGPASAKIKVELPSGWKVATVEKDLGNNAFETVNIEKTVFFVGKNWREQELAFGRFRLNAVISGEWRFGDGEAFQIIDEIYSENRKLFGTDPTVSGRLFLLKFPLNVNPGNWEAETRGPTVTILSSDMPFRTQSIQRLHEQLRHEIFHLWMPNGVNFTGNYDWFYEGFALYQSLKTGVLLNRIRFEDFLDTLSRAHSIDSLQAQRPSLLDASKNRWSGANTQVYARGMLAAFLIDIALLQKTKGKKSVADMIREIYEAGRSPNAPRDGSEAILQLLSSYVDLRPIAERYIRGKEKIEWQAQLKEIGLESTENNFVTELKVVERPSGRQKDLLAKLGYNNWRKLSANSK